jgi:hypothetical protein
MTLTIGELRDMLNTTQLPPDTKVEYLDPEYGWHCPINHVIYRLESNPDSKNKPQSVLSLEE